jgi:hypothetical protein
MTVYRQNHMNALSTFALNIVGYRQNQIIARHRVFAEILMYGILQFFIFTLKLRAHTEFQKQNGKIV